SVRDLAPQGDVMELVPPADSVALADALHRLGNNRVWQEILARAAAERFKTQYTEERMLNAYRDLYLELLGAMEHTSKTRGLAHVIRPVHANDLPAIVNIHQKAFSEFFLTRLGPKFLHRYYKLVLA